MPRERLRLSQRKKTVAFVKIDGMIDKILVKEGSRVAQGKTLAMLIKKILGLISRRPRISSMCSAKK